ncbi:MAG: hypothetical protein J6Y70_00455 [Bacilli bacterium]|nr:hypothetical protein [Bacilli bacterium]
MIAKLVNFIRETTWLQPLLVSMMIFCAISMIPLISKTFINTFLMPRDTDIFYRRYDKKISGVDEIMHNFISYEKDRLRLKNVHDASLFEQKIPTDQFKYFLLFLDKGNALARDFARSFYDILGSRGSDNRKIILYTVYVDDDKDAFTKLFLNNKKFFEKVRDVAKKNDDVIRELISLKIVDGIMNPDCFNTPLLLLINFDKKDAISVYFDVKGSDNFERVKFLYDCWNNG